MSNVKKGRRRVAQGSTYSHHATRLSPRNYATRLPPRNYASANRYPSPRTVSMTLS